MSAAPIEGSTISTESIAGRGKSSRMAQTQGTGGGLLAAVTGSSLERDPATGKITNKSSIDYIARSFLAGGIAGCAAKTCVAPLDRVKILFQTNNPHYAKYSGSVGGIQKAINAIYSEFGFHGLFQGHSVTLMRIFPYAAIKFMAYEQVKNVKIPFTENVDSNVKHFVSGSIAGSISVSSSYPLDLLRVRLAFQVRDKKFMAENCGPDGKAPTSITIPHAIKKIYSEPNPLFIRIPFYSHYIPEEPPVVANAAYEGNGTSTIKPSGSIPGLAQTTVRATTAPIKRGILTKGVDFVAGIMNFYHGFAPTIYGIIPYAGVSFLVYENLKKILRNKHLADYTTVPANVMLLTDSQEYPTPAGAELGKPLRLKWWSYLLCGALSGAISQTTSYPLEVIRRNMQVAGARRIQESTEGKKSPKNFTRFGTWQTAKSIYKLKGWRGFFVGLSIGYIKVIPMSATSFFVYEFMKEQLYII